MLALEEHTEKELAAMLVGGLPAISLLMMSTVNHTGGMPSLSLFEHLYLSPLLFFKCLYNNYTSAKDSNLFVL